MASLWKLILPLPTGQRTYLFHLPVSVSGLLVTWGNWVAYLNNSDNVHTRLCNYKSPFEYEFCGGSSTIISLVCLGTGGRQVNPLPISKSHRLPDPSPQGSAEAEPENEGSRMSDGS